jgi:hypothetical protein
LGKGDDLIQGFGSQNVNGGKGVDTAELGIDANFDADQVTLGRGTGDIDIAFAGATMSFTNVELFNFNGNEIPLLELQAQAMV